jgi:hypothetical protein
MNKMKNTFFIITLSFLFIQCTNGKNKDSKQDDVFWNLIERSWEVDSSLNSTREKALNTMDKQEVYNLQANFDILIKNIEKELRFLNKEELTAFNHFIEKKLYIIDRQEIQRHTDGGDDGFYYVRGFILSLGKEYYNKIDRKPRLATFDAEFEAMCFIGYRVYEDKFNEEFKRYKYHNASTFSNKEAWSY